MARALVSVVLLVLCCLSAVSAVNVFVKPSDEMCFFETAQKGDKILCTFNVAQGGFLDIDLKVYGPDSKVVYEAEREKEGSFQFVASTSGNYRVCFGNSMSTVTGKTVSFNLYVGNAFSHHDAATKDQIDPLETSVAQLSEGLKKVRDVQNYMRTRERVCTATNESTNSRVITWNILKTLMLVGMAVFQLVWVRRFFEKAQSK